MHVECDVAPNDFAERGEMSGQGEEIGLGEDTGQRIMQYEYLHQWKSREYLVKCPCHEMGGHSRRGLQAPTS